MTSEDSDTWRINRKPLIVAGYGISNVVKPLLAFASGWGFVLGLVFVDRAGKGLRGSPRDTLLAGFSTCRDMGPTWPFTDVDLRDAIDKGAIPGPRLQVAGNYVSATGGAGRGPRA